MADMGMADMGMSEAAARDEPAPIAGMKHGGAGTGTMSQMQDGAMDKED
jgi:hypothetical protein